MGLRVAEPGTAAVGRQVPGLRVGACKGTALPLRPVGLSPTLPGVQAQAAHSLHGPRAAGQSVLGLGGEAAVLWCEWVADSLGTPVHSPDTVRGPRGGAWLKALCTVRAQRSAQWTGSSSPTSRLLGRCRLPFRRWGLCSRGQVSTLCLGFLICKIRTRTGLPRRWSGRREPRGQSTQGGCSKDLGLWARDPRCQLPPHSPQPRLKPSNGLLPDGGHGPVTLPLQVPSSSSVFTSEASPRACVPSLQLEVASISRRPMSWPAGV